MSDCPVCLGEINCDEQVFICDQCKSTYHGGCNDGAQCHVCRKVFDQDKVNEMQKKLIDHYDATTDPHFYDETYEDDTSTGEDEYYEDEEWLPDGAEYPDQLRVGSMRVTRSAAVALRQAGLIEHPFALYFAPLGSLYPEEQ